MLFRVGVNLRFMSRARSKYLVNAISSIMKMASPHPHDVVLCLQVDAWACIALHAARADACACRMSWSRSRVT